MATILSKQNIEDIFALGIMQESMFYQYLKKPDYRQYFQQLSLYLEGKVQMDVFKNAWKTVIKENEALRTVFAWQGLDRPVQIVLKEIPLCLKEYDLTMMDDSEKELFIRQIKDADFDEIFNLEKGSLFRIILGKLTDQTYIMILSYHHILFDGWSTGIVLKEFFSTYNQLVKGVKPEFPQKLKYKDYIRWSLSQDPNKQKTYWQQYLSNFDPKILLPLITKKEDEISAVDNYMYRLPIELMKEIEEYTQKENITMAAFFYTIWGILLQKCSNTDDVVFGTTVSGRSSAGANIENTVGLFINTLPLRAKINKKMRFSDLLHQIQQDLTERQPVETTSIASIKSFCNMKANDPIFDSIVVVENYPLDKTLTFEGNQLQIKSFHSFDMSNFDLTLAITTFGQIEFNYSFNPDLYTTDMIERVVKYYVNILTTVLIAPDIPVSVVEIISPEEKQKILAEFNDSRQDYPAEKRIQQIFQEQVALRSHHPAVVFANQSLTYGELNEKSNQLAHQLLALGVQKDTIVSIMLDRSIEMIIGIFGILKAGGAYLPIDSNYPTKRIEYMLQDSDSKYLITMTELSKQTNFTGQIICLDDTKIYASSTTNPKDSNLSTNLAYVIYTSGSTGRPKGVMIEHKGVINLIKYYANVLELTKTDRILQFASFAFDASVAEIFLALLTGATLYLLPQEIINNYAELTHFINHNQITIATFPPNYLHYINPDEIHTLRNLITAGSATSQELVNHWKHKVTYINAYGPTETTVGATLWREVENETKEYSTIPIGKPNANTKIYVLDQHHNLCPIGVIGEMYINSDGLARGYLNKPDLSAEKFLPDPFIPGKMMYKTGDLARWLPDGNLEFHGRKDHQVKIRGYRIELGEIEQILLHHAKIQDTVVVPYEDSTGETVLCAYVVSTQSGIELSSSQLVKFLGSELPKYMIPNHFIQLEKLPLTSHGKIDREALPQPQVKVDQEFKTPVSGIEKRLAQIWAEILGIEEELIGLNSDFFELGGHSLRATRMILMIHKVFKVKVPLNEIFHISTLKNLAAYIQRSTMQNYTAIEPAKEQEYYELSSAQKRVYFLQQMDLSSTSYNIPGVVELLGHLERHKLESVFKTLIERHESFRTAFISVDNQIYQKIHQQVEFVLDYYSCDLPVDAKETQQLIEEFVKPFDLSQAPLIRGTLIRLTKEQHLLLVDMHHIIADGTSMGIFLREFMQLYAGEELSPLRIQYKDFTEWQNQLVKSGAIREQEEFWLNLYSDDLPQLNLPTDYKYPEIITFEGETYKFSIPRALVRRLKTLAHEYNTTLYMNLMAAFYVILHKYTHQTDIIVGSGNAGRNHVDLQNCIGMFVNTLAIRNYPEKQKTYQEFLQEVKGTIFKAFENQELQFEELVEKLQLNRQNSRNPLFDVAIVMQNFEWPKLELADVTINPYDYPNKTSKFDLTLFIEEIDEELHFNLEYYTAIFKSETIQRFADHYIRIITQVIDRPEIQIEKIQILTESEKQLLLHDFIQTQTDYPQDKRIHEVFAEQVAQNPEAIAVIYEKESITYAQLDAKANQLANYLVLENQLQLEEKVGILLDRSIQSIVTILGILKAGGAYVPIVPATPEDRIKNIINDAQIRMIISEKRYIRLLNRLQWECPSLQIYTCLDTDDIYSIIETEKTSMTNKKLWEYVGETATDEITGGGWQSSYTGQPLTREEMDEYGENILAKVKPLVDKNSRVLEIGCASGISMFRIATLVGYYHGTDLSKTIIEKNKERIKSEGHENIVVSTLPAHEIDQIMDKDFDLVIINSVIQAFDGHNYLRNIIRKVINLMSDQSYIFIGDIMDQDLKDYLITDLLDFKRQNMNKNYKTKTDFTAELFVSREFFMDLTKEMGELNNVEFSKKIGTIKNELTRFRYDTLLTVNKGDHSVGGSKSKYQHDQSTVSQFAATLEFREHADTSSHNLAYVIYTSGTTGQPKGVLCEHRSLLNYISWRNQKHNFTPEDVTLQLLSIAFDGFGANLYSALLSGGRLILVDEDRWLDSGYIRNKIRDEQVTNLSIVPAVYNIILQNAQKEDLQTVRLVFLAGDRASEELIHLSKQINPDTVLINEYGPTENTIATTSYTNMTSETVTIIGKPIGNNQVFILDENNQLMPIGIAGELCVSGDSLSRGYYNRPDLTAAKFVSNPYLPGQMMYRTGDQARWLTDGNIEFIGRIDQQVKIRGFRIEPGEIEARLVKHDAVKEAVVTVWQDSHDEKYLAAYVVLNYEVNISELRDYLAERLPDYMIPSYFIALQEIPLTAHGKVDKKALPDPTGEALTTRENVAPTNLIEERLVSIWVDLLGDQQIGIDDDFFELGGHSLKATGLVSRISKELNVELPLRQIFNSPTIRELAAYIQSVETTTYSSITPVEEQDYYPLSSAQSRLFILDQMEGIDTTYNMPGALKIEGILDKTRLDMAFRKLIARHESLRTSFTYQSMGIGEPVQRILREVEFQVEDYQINSEDFTLNQVLQDFVRPFDLSIAPLLRVGLVNSEDKQYLLFDMHHIISDALSMEILIKDFLKLYQGEELPPLKIQYKDFTYWQKKLFASERIRKQEEYWVSLFKDQEIEPLNLSTDYQRPATTVFVGDNLRFEISKELTVQLNQLAAQTGSTLFMVLLAAYNILLAKYSGQEDIIVGSPIAGRQHTDLENIIGMFVNTLPLRNYPSAHKSFIELLAEVRETSLKAYENQDYQFEMLVERLDIPRLLNHNPLFDTMFALQNATGELNLKLEEVRFITCSYDNKIAKFDITVDAFEAKSQERIQFMFNYSTSLFKRETIERFAAHYQKILTEIVQNPVIKIVDIDMLSEEEKEQLCVEFNHSTCNLSINKTLMDIFEEQVERNPNQRAVSFHEQHLTYGELNQRVNQLAWNLRKRGIDSEQIVGIMVERSLEMIIGIFGILKAGGAYLPIDPNYPEERIQYLYKDSKFTMLLTKEYLWNKVSFVNELLNIEDETIWQAEVPPVNCINKPGDLAYVIYTSGSTGRPKGVMIEHQGVVNILTVLQQLYPTDYSDAYLLKTSYTFDVSVTELFGWYFGEGRLVVLQQGGEKDPSAIINSIAKDGVTHINFAPSMFNVFLNALTTEEKQILQRLKYIFLAGEAISKSLVTQFYQINDKVILENIYGPTEATIYTTSYSLSDSGDLPNIPIGKPLPNIGVYILNKQERLQPIGVVGELCIAGVGLARGYLNSPELTVEKFIENPIVPGQRLYKTGDLVRWLPDGNIEFIGRKDYQVKIRGFRIELGEIEAELLLHQSIKEAIVIDRQYEDENRYLCAYLVTDVELSINDLRSYLSESLPEYMIPDYFVRLDAMPLNSSGKRDREALPAPDGSISSGAEYLAPRNQVEERLVTIWSEILGLDIKTLGVRDNFFAIGGHSLKAVKVITRIQQEFEVKISLQNLFKEPTIAGLAQIIQQGERFIYNSIQPLPERAGACYDVSFAQKRLLILNKMVTDTIAYNLPGTYLFQGDLDRQAFESACDALTARHESLRTIFKIISGEPKQIIQSQVDFKVTYLDLRANPEAEKLASEEADREFKKPFNLETGPLFRITVAQIQDQRYLLIFTMHHIISDGWSMDIFRRNLLALYQAFVERRENPLKPLRIQYKDFANWQNQQIASGTMSQSREYWHQQLAGNPQPVLLPYDYLYQNLKDDREGASCKRYISRRLLDKLYQYQKSNNASLFMLLLGTFSVLLSQLSGQKDIVIAAPAAAREHEDLKDLIGFFINTVIHRTKINPEEVFSELVQHIKENTIRTLEHQSYPYELLLEELNLVTDKNQPALTSIFFNLLNFELNEGKCIEDFTPTYCQVGQTMKFDLGWYVTEYTNGLEIDCTYRSGLFTRGTIEYIMQEYVTLLNEVANNPEIRIGDLNFFKNPNSQSDRVTITHTQQEFAKEEINQSIVSRFEKIAGKYSDKLAVKTKHNHLTYGQLNSQANQVAYRVLKEANPTNRLTEDELTRYSRQMLIDGWGVESQEKLKQSVVFVAGAGGSGSPMIMQLALLGVGTIIISDPDVVDVSNLNRQFLHDSTRIGMNKALSAKMTVERVNPWVKVIAHQEKITWENVNELIGDAQIIFDNVDDLEAKFVLSECAVDRGIPHIISSMMDLNSYVAIFHAPKTPCFHCLYDRKKLQEIDGFKEFIQQQKKFANPVASPSLFASTGFACNEAIKILLGYENPAYNRYFLFNQRASKDVTNMDGYLAITYPFSEHFRQISRDQGFDWNEGWRGQYLEELTIWPDPDCPVCGNKASTGILAHSSLPEVAVSKEDIALLAQANSQSVALLFEHDTDMIIGIFGALKAGMAYVPLDPTYPVKRLVNMLEDSKACLLITNDKNLAYAQRLSKEVEQYLKIVNIDQIDGNQHVENLNIKLDHEKLTYLIYTSGSTGQPKGVMQNHHNVLYFIQNYTTNLKISAQDRLTQLSSYSFDAAVMDIFGALLNGATLYPYNVKEEGDLENLVNWLIDEEITIYHSIPTLYRYFIENLSSDVSFPSLRLVVLGGEAVYQKDVEAFKKYFSDQTILINGLGPTESTVALQYFINKHTEITNQLVPVGYPVDGTEILLINQKGERAKVFEVGEMVYKSDHLALGYWKRPMETEKAFSVDPFSGEGRVYYTGDLGKMRPDGSIEFVGRKDAQVKVRGYRIELNEIEMALNSLEVVKKSAVITLSREREEQELIAYYESYSGLEVEEQIFIKDLAEKLPDYMIPTRFIHLDALLLTSTGKIDRLALGSLTLAEISSKQYISPETDIEQRLVRIWSGILGIDRIGLNDNFFELGGHSLKAISMISQIQKEFDVEVKLQEIFVTPTLREVAQLIATGRKKEYSAIEVVEDQEYYPLSSTQKRLFVLSQFMDMKTAYNISTVLLVRGKLDLQRLNTALKQLIQRHEILRTGLEFVTGEPVQKIYQNVGFEIEHLTCNHLQLKRLGDKVNSYTLKPRLYDEPTIGLSALWDEQKVKILINQFIRPFDLSKAPLIRVGLIEPERKAPYYPEQILIIDLHHIISDGASLSILVNDLIAFYEGKTLPELRIQYKDFSVWQNNLLVSSEIEWQEEFWLNTFAGEIPILNLPTDYPRPSTMSFDGDRIYSKVSEELTFRLNQLARAKESTLYMVLLAAYSMLLANYTGQDDIIVGSPVAGRSHEDVRNLIGMFVNTLAMRNFPQSQLTIDEFLTDVRKRTFQAFENQDYPFEMLIESLDLDRDMSHNPLFDVMFVMQNMDVSSIELSDLKFTPYQIENKTAKFDLTLTAAETEKNIHLIFEYNTGLFKHSSIERLGEHFLNILNMLVTDTTTILGQVEMITLEEKARIIEVFNNTSAEYPIDKTIQDFFEEQVVKSPNQIALTFEGQVIKYYELNSRANQLAAQLRLRGVRPDQIVGVMVERSVAMILGILGIIKAGGAYLPIDADYPEERIDYMLTDSGARILLSQKHLMGKIRYSGEIIDLDSLEQTAESSAVNLDNINTPDDLLYVIYTSGSTGKPKGVMLEHRNLMNLLHFQYNQTNIDFSRVLQFTTISFDVSFQEIFSTLIAGGILYLITKELRDNLLRLMEYISINQIRTVFMPASYIKFIISEDEYLKKLPQCIRHIVTAGEQIIVTEKFRRYLQNNQVYLHNHYGPSETHVVTTLTLDPREDIPQKPSIGRPISNCQIYILNDDQQVQPIGIPGEVWITGENVGRGYLYNPEMTESRFLADFYNLQSRRKVYRTGDLGRWLEDGQIEFLGRKDHQVKVRGFRIELGEIESQLLEYQGMKDVVVIAFDDSTNNKYLVGYLVHEAPLDIADIRNYLLKKLPDYMVPSYLIQLDELPLTPNQKVDRLALPKPDVTIEQTKGYQKPETEVELALAKIWEDVLGINQVGLDDNFFELGGHSLKATSLIARIYQKFEVELPLNEIFKHPNVKLLAEVIQTQKKNSVGGSGEIVQLEKQPYYPLSAGQKRIYLINLWDETSTSYNISNILTIGGNLDLERFEQAVLSLIQRHEPLRTSFTTVQGEPVQVVHEDVEFQIDYLRKPTQLLDEAEIQRASTEIIRPFDLEKAPLFRVGLIEYADVYLCVLTVHHIIADGISLKILVEEFIVAYIGQDLPELKIQYKDFAVWQNNFLNSPQLIKQERYWLEKLEGLTYTELPNENTSASNTGSELALSLDPGLNVRVEEFCLSNNLTRFNFVLGVLKVVLYNKIGQADLAVGVPISGRNRAELEKLMGLFLNVLVIRSSVSKDLTFKEYLHQLNQTVLEAFEKQDYPYDQLDLRIREVNHYQGEMLFSILFNYLPYGGEGDIKLHDIIIREHTLPNIETKYDLTFYASEGVDTIDFRLVYKRDKYDESMIQKLGEDILQVIEMVLAREDLLILDIDLTNTEAILEEFDVFDELDDLDELEF